MKTIMILIAATVATLSLQSCGFSNALEHRAFDDVSIEQPNIEEFDRFKDERDPFYVTLKQYKF